MALSLSREFLLVAACSIWPSSDRRAEAIHQAAAEPLDWDRVLRVAMRHRVAGLVHNGLATARLAIPTGVAKEIAAHGAAIARQNLELVAEGLKLQRMFTEADLPVVFIKGVSLAMLAYGNLGIRHGRDLDLLVAPNSIAAATAILERAGYRQYEPPAVFDEAKMRTWLLRCKEVRYAHNENGYEVELHARLFDNPRLMDVTTVMSSLRTVRFAEAAGLLTFGPDDLFSYLCAHGAVHCWFRLKWLADIGAILAQQPEGGAERLYRAANARGVGRCAAQAIFLCQRLLGTVIPDQLITTLCNDASIRWLEAVALKAITADLELPQQLLGTMRKNLSLFALRQEWRYRLTELDDQLFSPVDILTLPLPQQLRGLYPILRLPLWFWRRIRAHGGATIR